MSFDYLGYASFLRSGTEYVARALTSLATFFITLSFVAALLRVNVSELSTQSPTSVWVFFAIAAPLTILSLIIVGKWAALRSLVWTLASKLPSINK